MNLRCDDTFVEDEGGTQQRSGMRISSEPAQDKNSISFELGIGYNTPVIIKYPFWQMTAKNPNAIYACIN